MLPHNDPKTIYPVVVPIETNRGRGETRTIGPTRVTFVTSASFETGDAIRFAITLRGNANEMVDVFCAGSVCGVSLDGELFVVEASIEATRIAIAKKEEKT